MVTRILFDPRRDLPGGTTQSNPVTIEATPTGIRENGQVVIYPTTISTPITTGADIFQLPANTASNGWRLTVRDTITSAVKQQRVVRVPDQASIAYQSLPDIDPASFTVTPGTARQWDATFWALTQALGTLPTDAAVTAKITTAISALVGGASTALDTLGEIQAALGSDPNLAATLTTAISARPTAVEVAATYLPKPVTGDAVGSVPTKQSDGSVAYVVPAAAGGGLVIVDNLDGTATLTASGSSTITDNGDGTATIAA